MKKGTISILFISISSKIFRKGNRGNKNNNNAADNKAHYALNTRLSLKFATIFDSYRAACLFPESETPTSVEALLPNADCSHRADSANGSS
jgi:hypothetical protein